MIILGGKGGEREEHEVNFKAVGKILFLDLSTSMMDGSTFWKLINMYFCELYILLCVLCCCSDTKLCLTLCNPINCSMPGYSVLHCFLEFAQIRVHLTDDAIQPSHTFSSCPQSFSASGSFPMSWLFTSDKEFELQLQYQYFQWIFSVDPLGLTGLIFLLSKGFSRVFSSTTIWKHQFFSAQPSLLSNSHVCT